MEFPLLLHGPEEPWRRATEEERTRAYAEHTAFLAAVQP